MTSFSLFSGATSYFLLALLFAKYSPFYLSPLWVTTISYSYGATLCELRYKYSKKNEFEVMKDGFIIMTQWCSGNPLIIVMQHFYQKLHMSPAVRFSEMANLTSSDFQRINFSLKNLVISKFLDCF